MLVAVEDILAKVRIRQVSVSIEPLTAPKNRFVRGAMKSASSEERRLPHGWDNKENRIRHEVLPSGSELCDRLPLFFFLTLSHISWTSLFAEVTG